jgi:hypothetical protein
MDSGFRPEYLGDNENREWVRQMMHRKGFKVDRVKLIKTISEAAVSVMFYKMIMEEFPDA